MASIHEHKNNERNARGVVRSVIARSSTSARRTVRQPVVHNNSGIRTVSHLPGGVNCTNCYLTNKVPCDDCQSLGYETKRSMMSWNEFKDTVDPDVITNVCDYNMPGSYGEFCEMYEMFHDLPDIVNGESDIESLSESSNESYNNGYDSVS